MKAHRLDWGSWGAKNPQLTKKAAAAIPTPAARIEVITWWLFWPGLSLCCGWWRVLVFGNLDEARRIWIGSFWEDLRCLLGWKKRFAGWCPQEGDKCTLLSRHGLASQSEAKVIYRNVRISVMPSCIMMNNILKSFVPQHTVEKSPSHIHSFAFLPFESQRNIELSPQWERVLKTLSSCRQNLSMATNFQARKSWKKSRFTPAFKAMVDQDTV